LTSIVVTPSPISASRRGRVWRTRVILVGLAQSRDGRDDAAAGPGNVGIARTLKSQLELQRAVARVDQMRVAIDKPWRDPAALAVDGMGA
jgi:hypothetical protein